MAILTQPKHITSPLDHRIPPLLRCDFTCHSPTTPTDHHTSALLNDFLDSESDHDHDHDHNHDHDHTPDSDTEPSGPSPLPPLLSSPAKLRALLSPPPSSDPFRSRLASDVKAMASSGRTSPGPAFRHAVMARLRERGYDAGVCRARWEGGGGVVAGSYEYIDVVVLAGGGGERRYIVDLGFRAEFEVARATEEYERVKEALPEVAVAEAEGVRVAVRAMAEAGRRSLKSRGMSVPPWRKKGYMMAKWFGFYRRTVSAVGAGVERGGEGEARWRAVGFGFNGGN